MSKSRKLSAKESVFVAEYLNDLNATQSAIRAGYSERTARQQGCRLLTKVNIQNAIAIARKEREERTHVSQDDVVMYWSNMMRADPSAIVRYVRTCCRHCHGKNNKYQWIDLDEFFEAEKKAEEERDDLERTGKVGKIKAKRIKMPSQEGGFDFDPRKPPSLNCKRCFGAGVSSVFIADTRTLGARERLLYAGVKEGKSGLEVKLNDQFNASIQLARHLGMFDDKLTLAGGVDVRLEQVRTLTEEEKAAKILALLALHAARLRNSAPDGDGGDGGGDD